jgi:hypothetical protein
MRFATQRLLIIIASIQKSEMAPVGSKNHFSSKHVVEFIIGMIIGGVNPASAEIDIRRPLAI